MSIYYKNSEGKLDRFLQEPEIVINDRGTSIKYTHLHIQFGTRTAIYANEYVLQEWYLLPVPFDDNNYTVLVTKPSLGNTMGVLDIIPIGQPGDNTSFLGGYQRFQGGFTSQDRYDFNYLCVKSIRENTKYPQANLYLTKDI